MTGKGSGRTCAVPCRLPSLFSLSTCCLRLFTSVNHKIFDPLARRCPSGANKCRAFVKESLLEQCLERITKLGDLYGRDRTFVGTVAFGPPDEDYQALCSPIFSNGHLHGDEYTCLCVPRYECAML